MPWHAYLLSMTACILLTLMTQAQDAGKEEAKFQGSWDITDFVKRGKSRDEKGTFVFADGKLRIESEGDTRKSFTFKLDPSTELKSINLTSQDGPFKGQTSLGIYRFEGETLQICVPNQPTKERPTEFAAPEKSEWLLITLKKAKT